MEKIFVAMIRPDLDDLPQHDPPAGYSFRTFGRGDERIWADVQTAAGAFDSIDAALARFSEEFAPHLDDMESRCLFLVDDATGREIGSTTAWYNDDFHGEDYGRIHWVAIRPDYQGRKLAKPMLSAAMKRLAESHVRAYLITTTHCTKAIRMYLDYGFAPARVTEKYDEAWEMITRTLREMS